MRSPYLEARHFVCEQIYTVRLELGGAKTGRELACANLFDSKHLSLIAVNLSNDRTKIVCVWMISYHK